MDIKKNRRLQLLLVIEKMFNGKSGQCADRLEIKRPQLSRWITTNAKARQGISEDAARSIEKKLGLAHGALDADTDEISTRKPVPQAHTDLLMAWELLTQEQRQGFISQIKAQGDTNKSILEQLSKQPRRPATAVAAGPPSAPPKKNVRRTRT